MDASTDLLDWQKRKVEGMVLMRWNCGHHEWPARLEEICVVEVLKLDSMIYPSQKINL